MNTSRFYRPFRHKAVTFMVVFAVCAFLLLTTHGFMVDTVWNDFYLFQVAKSTAYLLSWVGDSAEVIGNARSYPGREAHIRASMRAWQSGDDEPEAEELEDLSAPPLTSWERWRYHAMSQRQKLDQLLKDWAKSDPANNPQAARMKAQIQQLQNRDLGPTVSFVFRRGLALEMAEARREIAKTFQNPATVDGKRSERLERARKRLQELEAKRVELAKTDPNAVSGLTFTFVVVPDCGAIPTMVIFVAAVLAFPTRWWKKLAGIGLGLPFLYVVNALRLTVLAVIGAWNQGGPIFKFAHEYVWQGIYIIFVVVAWLSWVELLARREKT